MGRIKSAEYKQLDLYDPQVTTLVTRCQQIFNDFDWNDLFTTTDENLVYYQGATA